MNYQSITDKPFIVTPKSARIHVCESCLIKHYTNSMPMRRGALTTCHHCSKGKECHELQTKYLIARPIKKRERKPSVMVQFNIFRRQIVVK